MVSDDPAPELNQSFQATPEKFTKNVGGKKVEITADGMHITDDAGKEADYEKGMDVRFGELQLVKTLGRGAWSIVELRQHPETGALYAVKVFNMYDKHKRGQVMKEIHSLYDTSCDALVDVYGCSFADGKISVALEYMNLGSLDCVLEKYGVFPEPVLASIAFQSLWGLAYLKHAHRLHRDIKPQNILANSHGQVKLTDFGIARMLENTVAMCATVVGTFKYMSPERIMSKKYSYPGDIWSLGIVMIECATGQYPFGEARSIINMVEMVAEAEPPSLPDDGRFSDDFREFVDCCLKKKPEERLPVRDGGRCVGVGVCAGGAENRQTKNAATRRLVAVPHLHHAYLLVSSLPPLLLLYCFRGTFLSFAGRRIFFSAHSG